MMWGLGYGENSQAALITRGLAEITRLGLAMGASAETFYGLAGIGDLIATCTSTLSRNRTAGVALAQGQSLNDILNSSKMVIEGVGSTQAAYYLAKKYKVEMPIITELYQVLYENKTVPTAITELMQREGKKE
jgi:glycerol-3-phosphate dehydrogenase (NAD(P)+)